jgi:hypothetical protein
MSNTLARFVAQFNRLPIAAGAAIEVQTDALTTLGGVFWPGAL